MRRRSFFFFSFSNEYYAFNKHPPFEAKFASAKTRRGTIFTTQSWNLEIVAKILFDAIITPLSLSTIAVKIFRLPPPLVENGGRISDKSVLRMYLPTSPMSKLSSGVRSSSQRGLNLACVPACT